MRPETIIVHNLNYSNCEMYHKQCAEIEHLAKVFCSRYYIQLSIESEEMYSECNMVETTWHSYATGNLVVDFIDPAKLAFCILDRWKYGSDDFIVCALEIGQNIESYFRNGKYKPYSTAYDISLGNDKDIMKEMKALRKDGEEFPYDFEGRRGCAGTKIMSRKLREDGFDKPLDYIFGCNK